jgi:hypothetical protein
MAALLLFCDGSVGTGWATAGDGVCAAVGVVAVDGGRLSSGAVPDVILPEGGGTGAKKLLPELEVVDPAVVAGGGGAGMVAAGGGFVGSCAVAPDGVTVTAVGGAADTGGAATGWTGCEGVAGAGVAAGGAAAAAGVGVLAGA